MGVAQDDGRKTRARWYAAIDEESETDRKRMSQGETNATSSAGFSFISNVSFPIGSSEHAFVPVALGGRERVDERARSLECRLCPRRCVIASGKSGLCAARLNENGVLISKVYGRPCSIAIDPIEKKPLFHFLPNAKVLSLGTYGCNLTCRFCQNWQISQAFDRERTVIGRYYSPESIVKLALSRDCPCVAFTYNEPTIWAEYAIDVAKLCREANIKTVLVSNGYIESDARRELYAAVDAANIDLKGFTETFYQRLTGGVLADVKETLRYVAKETDVHLEVTNLLIPGYNTDVDDLRRLCEWYVDELGADVPLHFSAFFPTWRLTDARRADLETLRTARRIALSSGVRYVYLGNVDDEEGSSTFCPNCGARLIIRDRRYSVEILEPFCVSSALEGKNGRCRCGAPISGVWTR